MSNLGHRVFICMVFWSSLVIFGCGDAANSSTLTLDARVGTAVRELTRAALARNANTGDNQSARSEGSEQGDRHHSI